MGSSTISYQKYLKHQNPKPIELHWGHDFQPLEVTTPENSFLHMHLRLDLLTLSININQPTVTTAAKDTHLYLQSWFAHKSQIRNYHKNKEKCFYVYTVVYLFIYFILFISQRSWKLILWLIPAGRRGSSREAETILCQCMCVRMKIFYIPFHQKI